VLVALVLSVSVASVATPQERIISKRDADMIFAFTRADWERYARQVIAPDDWTLRLFPYDTGTGLARFNRSTGVAASVQPLFTDQGALEMLVVGSYFPPGSMRITEEVVKQIEQAAQLDLGPAYSVSANHTKLPDTNLEGVELNLTRSTVDPRGPTGK
jgi:hypothetical protein